MDSQYYVEVLRSFLIPTAEALLRDEWGFQQGNAAVHSSHVSKKFLESSNVEVLDWRAMSLDLNIIENVWRQLVRKVYTNARRYSNVSDSQDAIMNSWNNIVLYICNL